MPAKKKLPPLHPGQLLTSLLEDIGLNAKEVALALRIPPNRFVQILNGERDISAETALRLARYFKTTIRLWTNLQTKYDLDSAEDRVGEAIGYQVRPLDRKILRTLAYLKVL